MSNGIDIISDTTGKAIAEGIDKIAHALGYTAPTEEIVEYGVRWVTGASNPKLTRVIRKKGIISEWEIEFTPNVGASITNNPFDDIALFNPEHWADSEGNQFKRFKRFYVANQTIGIYSYIWVCATQLFSFYRLPRAFCRAGQPYWNYVDIGVYEGGREVIGGVNYLSSKSGVLIEHNKSRTLAFEEAKAWGTKRGIDTDKEFYCITTMSEITEILQPLLLIMYGTRNSQAVYQGVCDVDTDDYYIVRGENNTNRFLLDNNANYQTQFPVGCNVYWDGGWRQVIENGTVSISGTTYFYVKVDGEPFDVELNEDEDTCIWRGPNPPGQTDSINATHGTVDNDGLHSFKVMGIENIYGNIYKHILDCTIQSRKAYICENLDEWTDTKTPASDAAFTMCDITLATSGWVKEITADEGHPDVVFPTAVGGSDSTYFSDYLYCNNSAIPTTVFYGGYYSYGSYLGLFCWILNNGLGISYGSVGARLSHRAL